MTRLRCRAAARSCALWLPLLFAPALLTAQDELGLGKMWTFERPPLAYLEKEYGFKPDQQWLHSAMLASLRFGTGCSASFVSPRGLILTNHHCVRDQITRVQGQNDWLVDGFVAAALDDEVKLPGLTVQQLVEVSEVTEAMNAGIATEATPADAAAAHRQNEAVIVAAAKAKAPQLRPQVVALFQGAVFRLYQYRVYDDVRLVMAPELQASHFGGDPDNFVFPRYAIDFAFCRAWQDGKPADTAAHYFPFSDGPHEGELVFLTGNPGSTSRLLTQAQLGYQRDVRYPRLRELIDHRIAILRELAAADAATGKRLRPQILGLENAQKLYRGEHLALGDAGFQQRKATAEAAFRARVAADPQLQARFGSTWAELEQVAAQRRRLDAAVAFHTAGGAPLLLRAMALVEFARSGDGKQSQLARDVKVEADAVQWALFADHLQRAATRLPADDPYLQLVLAGRTEAATVAMLQHDSRLADPAVLDELLQGGKPAILACTDPALVIARELVPLHEADQNAWDRTAAAEEALGARIAQALFAVYGYDVTPDATFTLRFSDGRVIGYDCNGTRAPWRTVFFGMFARSVEFDGRPPFDLPSRWQQRLDRIDPRVPVDFVCTVDSTGGNSGSPVIDQQQR
ncbi:MAG TPA: S46 family peptidase, partial [Planctomycetota bacterium]|nr:S46 family peptidase [Planctomycetota bacterium]